MRKLVLGIGAAVVDHIAPISYERLQLLGYQKGGTLPISKQELEALKLKLSFSTEPGGAAVNTLKGLSLLGIHGRLLGKRGDDPLGKLFENSLQDRGIESYLIQSDLPTSEALCLVTPDLGASAVFRPEEFTLPAFQNINWVHLEAYTLYNPGTTEKAMEEAKAAGIGVSLNLASFEVIEAFKENLAFLIERHVDLLFASRAEAFALTGLPAKEAALLLQKLAKVVVVTEGEKGAYVASESGLFHAPAIPTEVIDTTGAGDFFAAGFLSGYLDKLPLKDAALRGAKLASQVIQVVGTNLNKAEQ
jgi:sugar/nucleoside kinase (ribokinase family)